MLLLEGDVDALAGVYSFAFLGVMGIFSLGCMMLKTKRADLPREVVAPWWCVFVMIASLCLLLGRGEKQRGEGGLSSQPHDTKRSMTHPPWQ